MLLTIDIGNTNTSFCVFKSASRCDGGGRGERSTTSTAMATCDDANPVGASLTGSVMPFTGEVAQEQKDDEIVQCFDLASDPGKSADEYGILISNLLKNFGFEGKISDCAISSVVPALDEIYGAALQKYLNLTPFWINHKVRIPFEIAIEGAKELGADRIANAARAVENYKLPAIIIDFGTATTFDIIDENKRFIGGLIAPGLKLQAQSLAKFTSKLPKLKIEAAKDSIGRNTVNAMLSGIVLGHCAFVSGMIKKCEKELGQTATIVACGGFSEELYDKIERKFDFIDKDLTHKGIRLVWKLN